MQAAIMQIIYKGICQWFLKLIGELNSYNQFQKPLEYTFIYNLHGSSLHESFFHSLRLICNVIN